MVVSARSGSVLEVDLGDRAVPDEPRSSGGAAITFDRLEKRFGEVVAVSELSLEIAPGELLTLLGPSGSGKTTTLMMLAGFESPTTGEILVDGRPIADVPPHRRSIGMVFQSYALFPHLTVGDNIAFPLKQRRVPKDETLRRVHEALELVGLPGYESRYPGHLSGGQQQRVALARALVFNPRVLLMDEPLGALDKQLRERLQEEIRLLHRRLGVTILYVTHDQSEALALSDRIAVMRDGRIEQVGTPQELYDAPATSFVASFVGESNFLEGRLLGIDNGIAQVEVLGIGLIAAHHGQTIESSRRNVTIAIRPERIFLDDDAPVGETNARNVLGATVEEVAFGGEVRRYRLRLAGGQELHVKQLRWSGQANHAVGDRVHLSWLVEDGLIL